MSDIKYSANTEYYTIVSKFELDTVLPDFVVDFMGYDKTKTHTLASSCFPQPIELENGNYLINIQLCNAKYLENKCVTNFITPAGFELAKQFYTNIFTDISELKIKDIQ